MPRFMLLCALLFSWLQPRESIELLFAGDAMQHEAQIAAARASARRGRTTGTADDTATEAVSGDSLTYQGYYDAWRAYIASADWAVVNLETPLGGAPYRGYPAFCAPDTFVDALTEAGFDMVLLANNHILDRGDAGLRRTVDLLEARGIPFVGAYRDAAHRAQIVPRLHYIGGFRLAFLNYTYGTNGLTPRAGAVVDYIDRDRIAADIRLARAAGAELVAVCIHWGVEYQLLPHPTQRQLAEWLADQGVDLIIGGHPHVVQPMELRRHPKTGRPYLLIYSLGNLISAMRTNDTRGGAFCRVVIGRDSTGRATVRSASYRLHFTQHPTDTQPNFRLLPAESEEVAPALRPQRDAFVHRAGNLFDKWNYNVPRDTLPLTEYPRIRRAEPLRIPYAPLTPHEEH